MILPRLPSEIGQKICMLRPMRWARCAELNRLVRPMITFGLLGILPAVIIWSERATIAFAALPLLPAGYWALVTVIIRFYFGGRMQLKVQDF